MTNYIRKQIADREKRDRDIARMIAQLEGERAVIQAEIRTYRDVLSHLSNESTAEGSDVVIPERRPGRKGLSKHWAGVLAAMAEKLPRSVGYDFIHAKLEEQGHSMARANLRRHMLSYIDSGYVERTRPGRFRPTEKGERASSLAPRKYRGGDQKNEAPDVPASDASGGGGSAPPLLDRQDPQGHA